MNLFWILLMLSLLFGFALYIRNYDKKFQRLHDAWVANGKVGKYPGCELGYHPLIVSRMGLFRRCPECGLKEKLIEHPRFDFDGDLGWTEWVPDDT